MRAKWVVVILLIVAGVAIWIIRDKRAAKEFQRSIQEEIQVYKKNIQAIAIKYNANSKWIEKIENLIPVYSLDRERLWTADNPILFIGDIADIYSSSNNMFILEVEYDDMILSVNCPSNIVDKYLQEIGEKRKYSIMSLGSVAVIANIKKVRVENQVREGEKERTIIGEGECLGLEILPVISQAAAGGIWSEKFSKRVMMSLEGRKNTEKTPHRLTFSTFFCFLVFAGLIYFLWSLRNLA